MSNLSPRAIALRLAHGPGPIDWERIADLAHGPVVEPRPEWCCGNPAACRGAPCPMRMAFEAGA